MLSVAHEEDINWNADNVHDWDPLDGSHTDEEDAKRAGIQEYACSAAGINVANLKLRCMAGDQPAAGHGGVSAVMYLPKMHSPDTYEWRRLYGTLRAVYDVYGSRASNSGGFEPYPWQPILIVDWYATCQTHPLCKSMRTVQRTGGFISSHAAVLPQHIDLRCTFAKDPELHAGTLAVLTYPCTATYKLPPHLVEGLNGDYVAAWKAADLA